MIIIFAFTYSLIAQVPENIVRYRADKKGDVKNRKKSPLYGNNIRTIYSNAGEVSDWYSGAISAPHLEWPKGSGHRHLDGFTLLVGGKLKIKNSSAQDVFITSIETQYREQMDKNPLTSEIWGFESIEGYCNPDSGLIAVSNNKNSWPAAWPLALGVDANWNGEWYGYFGKGIKDSVIETFYVMDDSRDKEFTLSPNGYYPIFNDSSIGGLGLRVEVRGMQFQQKELEDILFWNYDITNISDFSFDFASVGFFCDPVVNSPHFGTDLNMVYFDGYSFGGVVYQGYLGIAVLNNSTNTNISNIKSASIGLFSDRFYSAWPKNDLQMWSKMTGGFVDTVLSNSDLSVIAGSSVFQFPKWSTVKYSIAMILGNDLNSVIKKRNIAQRLYQNNYLLTNEVLSVNTAEIKKGSSPTSFKVYNNYPNPFNPTTTIQFSVPYASDLEIAVYDILGRKLTTIVSGYYQQGTFSVQWNAEGYSSGIYYYTLRSGNYRETQKMIIQK